MLRIAIILLIACGIIFAYIYVNDYMDQKYMNESTRMDPATKSMLDNVTGRLYKGEPVHYPKLSGKSDDAERLFAEGVRRLSGNEKNLYLSRRFLFDAAKAGSPRAMDLLGVLYDRAVFDGKRDEELAVLWFIQSAEYGSMLGNHYLCRYNMYKRDLKKAYPYCEVSAGQNVPMSEQLFGELLAAGRGVARNRELAAYYICKAGDAGRKVRSSTARYLITCD